RCDDALTAGLLSSCLNGQGEGSSTGNPRFDERSTAPLPVTEAKRRREVEIARHERNEPCFLVVGDNAQDVGQEAKLIRLPGRVAARYDDLRVGIGARQTSSCLPGTLIRTRRD